MTIAQDILKKAEENSMPHFVVATGCELYAPYKINMHVRASGQMFSGIRRDADSANGMLIVFPDNSVLIDECWNGTYKAVESVDDLQFMNSYNGGRLPLMTYDEHFMVFGWTIGAMKCKHPEPILPSSLSN